jgi:hypothetical protein
MVLIGFIVTGGRFSRIAAITDPERICRLAAAVVTAGCRRVRSHFVGDPDGELAHLPRREERVATLGIPNPAGPPRPGRCGPRVGRFVRMVQFRWRRGGFQAEAISRRFARFGRPIRRTRVPLSIRAGRGPCRYRDLGGAPGGAVRPWPGARRAVERSPGRGRRGPSTCSASTDAGRRTTSPPHPDPDLGSRRR